MTNLEPHHEGAPDGAPTISHVTIRRLSRSAVTDFDPAKVREWARVGIAVALIILIFCEIASFIAMAWASSLPVETIKDLVATIFVPTVALTTAAIAFYFAGDR